MKNIKKFLVLGLSLVMVSTFALAGCGSSSDSSDSSDSGTKILFSISTRDQFLTSMETAAADYADTQGVELNVMDAEDDITKQLSHVQTAVTDGYDAVVVNLVNTDNASEIISSAGDLPVVFVNRNPGEDNLEADKYVYVGSDENYSGGYQAEYLASYFEDMGQTDVKAVLLEGMLGQEAATTRTASVKAGLEDAGLNVDYVYEDTAKWDRATAQEMFTQFLGTGQEYDCVICNNDEMALGVVAALELAGEDPSEVPIVGVDATTDGCEAVEAGKMAFTVYQSAPGQGEGSVEAALALINGESISTIENANDENTVVWVPFEPVSADNVSDYLE